MLLTSLLHTCIPVHAGWFSTTLCSSCHLVGKYFSRVTPGALLIAPMVSHGETSCSLQSSVRAY
jgi:hypothetical protein